jgi:hypothetical protein
MGKNRNDFTIVTATRKLQPKPASQKEAAATQRMKQQDYRPQKATKD